MGMAIRVLFRRCLRLLGFLAVLGVAGLRFGLFRRYWTATGRADWLHQTCRRVARVVGVDIRVDGSPARRGLWVTNHLSYLDVIVLASLQPCAFVAKREVRSWPILGWAARAAGTLFIRRERRSDLNAINQAIRARLSAGVVVVVFPEGTSSDGNQVLPFHPGIFESVAGTTETVTASWLGYRISQGDPATEICYWGDMTFGPHFFRLLGQPRIEALVRVGPPMVGTADRRQLARELRACVVNLADTTSSPGSGRRPAPVVAAV